jgi:hypothetical protein
MTDARLGAIVPSGSPVLAHRAPHHLEASPVCDRSNDPTQYDPPISQGQREALAVLRLVDDWETRITRRARNLMGLGFTEAEAYAIARASWRPRSGLDAA